MNDLNRIQSLRTELHQHCHNYYVLNSPIISDSDYDKLFRELQNLEAKYPEAFDPNSPTSRVGAISPNQFTKVRHDTPMLSLENSFTVDEAFKRITNEAGVGCEVILEPKIDGLAVSLKYANGNLSIAVTRGDHEVGDDVTANVRTVLGIPLIVDYAKPLEVRGEVYLSKANFLALNARLEKAGEETFSNARNAAAGSLKQKDSTECASRKLAFVSYYIVNAQSHGVKTQLELLAFLKALKFPVAHAKMADYVVIKLESGNQLQPYLTIFDTYRKTLPFETDGCVIKVNSLDLQTKLGNKTRVPRWATAFKYAAENAVTILKGVTCQVGRRGTITPVAELKAVEIAGVTVRRASLCNQNEVDRLGINIGDEVVVERAGEVIPKVIDISKKRTKGNWTMPETCPSCGTKLVRDGVHFFCPNDTNCKGQRAEQLRHAVGKGALDWDGFGSAMVDIAIDFGITKLSQLFELTDSKLDELFKPAFVRKFKVERERIKKAQLWRKINALGIENIGQTASKELCEHSNSLEGILDLGPDKLRNVLGPVASQNFIKFIESHVAEIDRLNELGYTFTEEKVTTTTPQTLSSKTFCLTGAMLSGTRPQVSVTIEQYGGKVKGSVGKDLDYLVAGEGGGAGKANAAQKHGTKVITEEELYKMMGIPIPTAPSIPDEEEF
jgi:DNA ligase (NAD+)